MQLLRNAGSRTLCASVLLLFLPALSPLASEASDRRLRAVRSEIAPRVDGWIDDAVWEGAARAEDFVQQRPDTGEPASAATRVQVLYTSDALYVAFECDEPEPEKILARALGRDTSLSDDDYFVLVLDTFLDRQNGVLLQINPNGARTDVDFRNEGENRNPAWDGIWSARTRVTETGWQGEIEVPWRTLRFPEGERIDMGINFERQRRWVNEQSHWSAVPRQFSTYRVSAAGTLEGLTGIESGRSVQVRPYALTRTERGDQSAPDGFDRDDWDTQVELGLDAKVGLSSNLTLDLTVNTDFAEVEVDDEVVNLTRFPLFFPEKREFFLEKANLFDFGSPANRLFFSRRIGLDDFRNEIPLLYGARLTGKVGRTDVGLLDILQDDGRGQPSRRFDVIRVKRDIGTRSNLGLMALQRTSGDEGESEEPTNRAVGIDGDLNPTDALFISWYAAMTDQDIDGLDEKDNHSFGARARWTHPLYVFTLIHETVGDGYRPAMGFSPRGAIDQQAVGWEFTPEPNWRWIRRFENQGFVQWISRRHGFFESRYIHVNPVIVGPSEERLSIYWERDFERLESAFPLERRAPQPGDVVFAPGAYEFDYWGLEFSTDPSRTITFAVNGEVGEFFDGDQRRFTASLTARRAPHWNLGLELVDQFVEREDPSQGKVDFDSRVVRVRLGYDWSNAFGLDLFTQWNNDEQLLLSQLRAHWIFGDESDLYFVVADARDDDRGDFAPRRGEITLKLSYARQL